jgi:hypothetical protein
MAKDVHLVGLRYNVIAAVFFVGPFKNVIVQSFVQILPASRFLMPWQRFLRM